MIGRINIANGWYDIPSHLTAFDRSKFKWYVCILNGYIANITYCTNYNNHDVSKWMIPKIIKKQKLHGYDALYKLIEKYFIQDSMDVVP